MKVKAEIRLPGNWAHFDLVNAPVRIERESHIGIRSQFAVSPAGDKSIILKMLEVSCELRSMGELQDKMIIFQFDINVSVPGVTIGARIAGQRQ